MSNNEEIIAQVLTGDEITQWKIGSNENVVGMYRKNGKLFIIIDSNETVLNFDGFTAEEYHKKYNTINNCYILFEDIYVKLVEISSDPDSDEQYHTFELI